MKLLNDLGFELVGNTMYKDGHVWDIHSYEGVLADYGELELAHDLGELLSMDVSILYQNGEYEIVIGDDYVDIKEYVADYTE